MPVGVEQWRAAVGVMANSAAAKPQSPIGPHWKKWLKASDPVAYKGCVVFLVVVAQLVSSGMEQCKEKMQEKMKEKMKEGSEYVCKSAIKGKTEVLAMRTRPSAVLVTSFLSQLLIVLCGHILQLHRHTLVSTDSCTAGTDQWMATPVSEEGLGSDGVWTRWFDPVRVGLMILLPPLTQLTLTIKHHWHHYFKQIYLLILFKHTTRVKQRMKSLSVRVHLILLYVCMSLSVCLHCWASLVYGKCSKKIVAEGVVSVMSVLFSGSVRTGVRMVTMIVFVNQMLLMMAGDVERNPGPGNLCPDDLQCVRKAIFSINHKWYDIGVELSISFTTLDNIKANFSKTNECLTEMLKYWLTRTSPDPSWSGLVEALSSEPVREERLAREIHTKYCATHDSMDSDNTRRADEYFSQKEIISEMATLETEFGELKDDVYESVRTQPVDIFKVRLTSFKVNDREHHMEYVKEIIDRKDTISGIWIELNSYLNFLNHEILQHVLSKFKNSVLQKRMDEYTVKIKTFFRQTRLCDFIRCWPVRGQMPPVDRLLKFIKVESHKDWETCTLEDLDNLKGSLATKLLLPKFILLLEKASKGSLAVIFSIPPSLVIGLQDDIRNTELKEFVDMGIETITVDGVVCYEAPLLQYTTHLKQLYTSRSPLQPLSDSKPKHLLHFHLARIEKQPLSEGDIDRFIRESLRRDMDDVVYKKTAMELSELGVMGDSSWPKVVLIEGAPGVGKTTFAWQQCRQWAEGKLLQAYSIVLLLPLRDNNIRHITSLPSLFRHSKGQVRDEVTRTVVESNSKGCLIWLEGWDELVEDLRSDSLFTELIRGIQLPAATIYITSRPWATRRLLEQIGDRISQHTELLALAKEQVNMRKRELSDPPAIDSKETTTLSFVQFIESYPVILAAMYTPVTAAIVEKVFKSAPHLPPTTGTQLYSAYVLMRLEHYLTEHPKYSDRNIEVRTLADLPEGVLADFQRLCALAYEGVSQQMIVFSSLPEGVSTLGLLQSVPQVYNEGEDQLSYNFLHYTVQEYLAALHLSDLPPQELMAIIDTKMVKDKCGIPHYETIQFKTTYQFVAGITKLVSYPADLLSKLLSQDAPTVYSWLYESQNQPLFTSVLGSGERYLGLPYSATTIDYFIAGYCLAHSDCTWDIEFYNLDNVAVEFLSKGCSHQLPETGISSKIVSASFSHGSITADGVKHFLTIPNSLLQYIQHLKLSVNRLDRRACEVLAEGVQRMPCLEKLDLSHNSLIGCGDAVQLVSCLHNSKLRELYMSDTGISDPDFESLASYIHSTTSLQELSIAGNDISVESIDSLCKALTANSSMRSLDMIGCRLTKSHCVCLGQLLRYPIQCKLEELNLSSCSLTRGAVREVVSGLNDNHTLKVLYLSDNQIGSEGAVAVATMLKRNSSLERLGLDLCSISSSGGVELGAAIERNKTLRELWLYGNALGSDGMRGLCVGLENNSSLEELHLNGDESIGKKGVSLLLKCVEEKNRGLKRLRLSDKYKRDISSALQSICEVEWS